MPMGFGGAGSTIPSTASRFEDDFEFVASSMQGRWSFTQSSGSLVFSTDQSSARTGVVQLSVSGIASGRAVLSRALGQIALPASSYWEVCWGLQLPVASDGTNPYTARIGLYDVASGDPSNGVYFEYTHDANGGRWETVVEVNNATSRVDTGISFNTAYASFKCYGYGDTFALFQINNRNTTLVNAPFAAPTLTGGLGVCAGFFRRTTANAVRVMNLDYCGWYYNIPAR